MTSFALAITLTILLFISPILLTTANAYSSVRDFKGRKAINGGNYYIRPYYKAGPDEGSLTWAYNASITNQNCPLLVTQSYDTLTLANISTDLSSKYIPLNDYVFINFKDNINPCNNDLSWSLMPSDPNYNTIAYVVADVPVFPRYSSIVGAFEIVDAEINQKNVYKFIHCSIEDDYGCMDVGWLANSSDPYLVMTHPTMVPINPFYFVLVKAF